MGLRVEAAPSGLAGAAPGTWVLERLGQCPAGPYQVFRTRLIMTLHPCDWAGGSVGVGALGGGKANRSLLGFCCPAPSWYPT